MYEIAAEETARSRLKVLEETKGTAHDKRYSAKKWLDVSEEVYQRSKIAAFLKKKDTTSRIVKFN